MRNEAVVNHSNIERQKSRRPEIAGSIIHVEVVKGRIQRSNIVSISGFRSHLEIAHPYTPDAPANLVRFSEIKRSRVFVPDQISMDITYSPRQISRHVVEETGRRIRRVRFSRGNRCDRAGHNPERCHRGSKNACKSKTKDNNSTQGPAKIDRSERPEVRLASRLPQLGQPGRVSIRKKVL